MGDVDKSESKKKASNKSTDRTSTFEKQLS